MEPRSAITAFFTFVCILQCLVYSSSAASLAKRAAISDEPTCGYQSCPATAPGKLNIHLVPHTHDDVGWLKTVDQYYFGSRSSIQLAGVQYIIDSVIQELIDHPDRRFIYVETAFLWKWWERQDEKVRAQVRSLINEGRLEIIGGGWSMNDEAVTHYHSIIDQFTWGFRRLNDTFGACARPRIGWQIDPFGHSREQASIFAQMGFDGMFFARLDYQDKTKRLTEKTAEFIWKGSASLGKAAELFTGILYNHYQPPSGFCFDVLCSDEPMIDDPDSPDNNIAKRIEEFLDVADKQARYYRTNNVIMTMGGDFTYQHAGMWYKNLDKLIRYVTKRNGTNYNIFYSTPSCYLKSLHDAKLAWPVKSDDFFPYGSDPHSYWTGYYSSRPTLKYFERMGNNFLQVVKQLSVVPGLKSEAKGLIALREAMGVMQHHDAVTGTEKQQVAEDYARILYKAIQEAETVVEDTLSKWLVKEESKQSVSFATCLELNISSCAATENSDNFVVTLYNPQSRPVSVYVRLPIQGKSYEVKDYTGAMLVTQIVPVPSPVVKSPGRFSTAAQELVFRATDIPAMGYQSYYINLSSEKESPVQADQSNDIQSNWYNVDVNDAGHVHVQWKNVENMELVQAFEYYEGAEGDNKVFENRSSGAYIFRPKQETAKSIAITGSYKVYKGPLVEELHQTVNDWISHVVRVYQQEDRLEFEWLVGPIPVNDKIGKEIVTKYTSSLKSKGMFETDSNGREMLKRLRNARPTWDVRLEEPVSGNYYPITTKLSLKDTEKNLKLSAFTDRAQGGTSMVDGEIELMVHRRLLKDDAFGVGEALNETAFGRGLVARGQHVLVGGSTADIDAFVLKEKNAALQLALKPWTLITPVNGLSFDEWRKNYNMKGSAIAKNLPDNVNILTLEPWKENKVLLRLEHLVEAGEAAQLSQAVEINLQDLFTTLTIVSVHETSLGGNQWKEEMNRLTWQAESNDISYESENEWHPVTIEDNVANVLLNPMEIRTFVIEVKQK